jgi:hypothetical protein
MVKNVGHWVDPETGLPVENPQSLEDGQFTSGHPYVSGHINGYGSFNNNNMKPWIFQGELDGFLAVSFADELHFSNVDCFAVSPR